MKMRETKRQKGFTLIEILVVVMILGLLISLAAPRLIGRTDDAKVVKARADISAIEQALNLYKLDSGNYPTSEQGLEALGLLQQIVEMGKNPVF